MESESRDLQHQAEVCAGTHQSDYIFKEENVPGLAEALAEVAYNWEQIAVALRLPKTVIEECREKGNDLGMKLYNVLHTWAVGPHSNAAQATKENLKTALASPLVQNPQLASELEDRLKTSLSLHTLTTSRKTIFESWIREVLVNQYSQYAEVPRRSWPPVLRKKFITLALIETSDQKSNYSIRGDTDDVLAKKTLVEYEDVFQEYQAKKLLILGRPGSGKTTLVHKLVRDWSAGKALQGAELVFLISLRMLMSSENDGKLSNILQFFYFDKNYLMKVSDAVEQAQGKRVCFILDGFDEYNPSNRIASVVSAMLNRSHLVNAMIIVTSRPAAASAADMVLDESFSKIEVFGFSKNQIMEYINTFPFSSSSSVNEAHSQKLRSYLSSHPGVLDLCYLPVNCAIICFIYNTEPDHLPDTQTQIYALFTRLIIIRQLTSRDRYRQLDALEDLEGQEAEDFKKLCSVAFDMTTQSQQVITRGPASSDEAHSLGLVTTDIIAGLSGYKNSYSFLHLTLQEFMAAYHLSKLNQEEQMSLIEKYGKAVHMLTVWKFYFGLVKFETRIDRAEKLFTFVSSRNGFEKGTQLFKVQCAYEAKQTCIVQLASLRQMDFISMVELDNYDMTAIAYTMSKAATRATPTTHLLLQFCGPVNDKLKVFLSKLNDRALEYLKCLEISYAGDASTTTQVEALANKLNRMGETDAGLKNLKCLDLCGNIGDKGLIVLANGLDGNHVLEELQLSSNLITAAGIHELMKSDCYLRHLNLSHNNIGDEGVAELAAGLDGNHVLKCLVLIECGISATNIYKLLKADCHLQYLDLSCNIVDDEGAIAVARGLKNNLTLKSINLWDNNFGVTGVKALAQVLEKPLSLDLSDNKVRYSSSDGATSSSSQLSENTEHSSPEATVSEVQSSCNLQELKLSGYYDYGNIVDIISQFKSLFSLDLSDNCYINESKALAIIKYVANSDNCQHLKYLGLSYILHDSSGFIKFEEDKPYCQCSGFIIDLSYNNIIDKTMMVAFFQLVKNYDRVVAVYVKGTNINNNKNTIKDLQKAFQHRRIDRLIIFDISSDICVQVPAHRSTILRKRHKKSMRNFRSHY